MACTISHRKQVFKLLFMLHLCCSQSIFKDILRYKNFLSLFFPYQVFFVPHALFRHHYHMTKFRCRFSRDASRILLGTKSFSSHMSVTLVISQVPRENNSIGKFLCYMVRPTSSKTPYSLRL